MANFAELRRFGLALPGVVERPHMGQPSLRANGKMLALRLAKPWLAATSLPKKISRTFSAAP